MILLEIGSDGLMTIVLFFAFLMFGPPLILIILAVRAHMKGQRDSNYSSNRAKVYVILAGIYLTISLGICGGMIN